MATKAAQAKKRPTSAKPQKAGIVPAHWRAAARRAGIRLGGFLLILFGLAVLLALISYDKTDPAWNRLTDQPARNWLGGSGAALADLLLQWVGLGAAVVALPFLSWGVRVVRLDGWGRARWQIPAMLLGVFFGALSAAYFMTPDFWPLDASLGGAIGQIAMQKIAALTDSLKVIVPIWAYRAGFGALSLVLLVIAMGWPARYWAVIGRDLSRAAAYLLSLPLRFVGLMGQGLRRLSARRAARADWDAAEAGFDDEAPFDLDDEDAGESEVALASQPRRKMKPPRPAKRSIRAKTPPREGIRPEKERQPRLDLGDGFVFPPLDLLTKPKAAARDESLSQEALEQNARLLEGVLEDFGVKGQIVEVHPGPVVTLYELEPAPGIKSSRVIGLADDIARSMSAISARVAVIPGRNAIGIELPNARREMVLLRELLASRTFEEHAGQLPMALGKNIGGEPVIGDLAPMPHLLVAGTTGSGKSVGVNAMILSLLYRFTPDECRFIMVDPKMLELSVYDGIPHLLSPVVTDAKKAVVALKWAVREMEDRYQKMSKLSVRNMQAFNEKVREAENKGSAIKRQVHTGYDPESGEPVYETLEFDFKPLPLIVVIVDELADLMVVAGKEVEGTIQRLAQMARAAGIHLILATQRPSVDVITGVIKANLPTRISFQVTSKIDSRTILESQGAEQLLGKGDMLFMQNGRRITRVHGPFVSDEEVERVVAHLKTQGIPDYIEAVTEDSDEDFDFEGGGPAKTGDDLYDRAVALVAAEQKASTSFIQRHLQIGYNRAARLIEQMEKQGVVGPANHVGKREVLINEAGDPY